MTFMKSQSRENTYLVSSSGKLVAGTVRKVGKVFRGTSTVWEAWRAGKYLGTFKTRNEAGAYLASC